MLDRGGHLLQREKLKVHFETGFTHLQNRTNHMLREKKKYSTSRFQQHPPDTP